MVAKFLDNKFLDISNFVDLLQYHLICQMLANRSGVVSESIVSKFRTRNGKVCIVLFQKISIPSSPPPTDATEIPRGGGGGGPKGGNFRRCGVLFRAFFFQGV